MPNVWLIKVTPDGESNHQLMSMLAARGMIDGFVRGGSAINVINGGVRVYTPDGGHWDWVQEDALDVDWRHTGPREELSV